MDVVLVKARADKGNKKGMSSAALAQLYHDKMKFSAESEEMTDTFIENALNVHKNALKDPAVLKIVNSLDVSMGLGTQRKNQRAPLPSYLRPNPLPLSIFLREVRHSHWSARCMPWPRSPAMQRW